MAQKQPRRKGLTAGRIAFGILLAWASLVAPLTLLLSWLFQQPTGTWLVSSLFLAIPAFFGLWWVIQHGSPALRWPIMQYFGWGAALLPLATLGAIATIWLPQQTVGLTVLLTWLVLGAFGVRSATKIAERFLTFSHKLLDRPYKLVQLSDVHVGSRSSRFLERAVEQAMRHQPDAILITGDLVDMSAVQKDDLAALANISCPVYFAIGNHERYIDLDAVIDMVEAQGVKLLRSHAVTQGQLQFIGIDDADSADQVGDHLPKIDLSDGHYRILLYHKPDGWHAARLSGIDLMLAGHTHGGQIWPFNYVVKRHFEHVIGLFSQDDKHLYVSPGTGCWGPVMRVGTRSEMTIIDLLPATSSN